MLRNRLAGKAKLTRGFFSVLTGVLLLTSQVGFAADPPLPTDDKLKHLGKRLGARMAFAQPLQHGGNLGGKVTVSHACTPWRRIRRFQMSIVGTL